MTNPYISGDTLDDIMHEVIEAIESHGQIIVPRKGECLELTGVLLELRNPRARLSRTETRGTPFSCLGELCWYLTGSSDLEFISYYIPDYRKYADGSGAYGPRLLNWKGCNQLKNISELLMSRPASRQAVIQLFDAVDIAEEQDDVPCTCTLQFIVRNQRLHMVTYMRSNDAFLGLPHDVFSFTMLQEIMARVLSVDLGTYKHVVGSLHLYTQNRKAAQRFLGEGWQSTDLPMPPMPLGDPWPAIKSLLLAERTLRHDKPVDDKVLKSLDGYWADLIRMLQVLKFSRENNVPEIEKIRKCMSSPSYYAFIDKKLYECQLKSSR